MGIREPYTFKRRVLLVVTGKTPQIVTETLYKLAVGNEPVFIPTEIHLVTTAEGAKSAKVALLGVGEQEGKFQQFCRDFALTEICFTENFIHVIEDQLHGEFLNDAQSTLHNEVASDFITQVIQELTQDEDSALHVSIAGGRKTMSYYAGYALSLYGRMQDRLSHVLVNEPFQNNREFFYPPPSPVSLEVDNEYFSTDDARIILADIPYVRMRYHVPDGLLNGKAGFQETVEKIQRFVEPESLAIRFKQRVLVLNNVPVKIPAADCAFYSWMAQRALDKTGALCLDDDAFMDDYLAVYARVVGAHSGMYERAESVALKKGVKEQKDWFFQRKGKVHKLIEAELGKRLAQPFLIETVDKSGKAAYQLKLAAESIAIEA
uniref:CRISPR-associated protein, Csx3 family n=1 Tax=uncultured Thiotrichaceae bacterium TaxID=298394 RepID=A0A6S6U1D7_9GAMM|nr:MAG: CRISPR-associated protein, Csx3 family [uncultured Thiotrichaceae bacterium]